MTNDCNCDNDNQLSLRETIRETILIIIDAKDKKVNYRGVSSDSHNHIFPKPKWATVSYCIILDQLLISLLQC